MLQTASHQTSLPATPSTIDVADIPGLVSIFRDEVNVVTLRKGLAANIADDVATLTPSGLSVLNHRLDITPAGLRGLRNILPATPHLAGDVTHWVEVFSDLIGASEMGVRLRWVTSAMCPRFHVDFVSMRLVCTYQGPSTEYLDNGHIDRRFLGHASKGVPDAVSGLLHPGARIQCAEVGDIERGALDAQ